MPSVPGPQIVREALALRASHPHAPSRDVLDLVLRDREVWHDDLFEFMVPSHPFGLLVAEAVNDRANVARCRAFNGLDADDPLGDQLRRKYVMSVWPKFLRRYGFWYPGRPTELWRGLERWAEKHDGVAPPVAEAISDSAITRRATD